VLLIAALLGALYWAIMFGPLYIDNLSVREAADIGITFARINDDAIINGALRRINIGQDGKDPIGSHMEENEDGTQVEKPGLALTAENITIERDPAAKTIKVSIDYSRTVRLKPTSNVRTLTFHVEKEGPAPQ
jgi:hypothetical protein